MVQTKIRVDNLILVRTGRL